MWQLFFDYRADVQQVLIYATCIAALIWGGGPEKMVAVVWLVLFRLVDGLYHMISDRSFILTDLDVFHATLDVAAAVGFILIALYANRMYTLWIAGLQLISVTAHIAREMAEAVTPIAYAVMVIAPSWGMLFALMGGLHSHRRRTKQHGEYRDWRGQTLPVPESLNPAARYFRIYPS